MQTSQRITDDRCKPQSGTRGFHFNIRERAILSFVKYRPESGLLCQATCQDLVCLSADSPLPSHREVNAVCAGVLCIPCRADGRNGLRYLLLQAMRSAVRILAHIACLVRMGLKITCSLYRRKTGSFRCAFSSISSRQPKADWDPSFYQAFVCPVLQFYHRYSASGFVPVWIHRWMSRP